MSVFVRDPLAQLSFSVYENKGIFALLLGSGLSRAAGIPTGWEITLDLIRRVASAQGTPDQFDWAQWYREETGEEPNYSSLLAELAQSPDERRSILHSYIEPTDEERGEGRKAPTAAHNAIAELVRSGYIRVIITTNFDRLMENALRAVGVEPTIVASLDALKGAEPITHSACYVLKLHGDYKDTRILNTDEELSTYPSEFNTVLDRIFDEFGLVVCGWSGEWDLALRAAVNRAPNRRYSTFWAARGAIGSGAQQLISQRKAQVLQISDADAFFVSLAKRVDVLHNTRQENPNIVELLVSSAKRYLAKPEHRIQLDDLMAGQGGQLIDLLRKGDFPAQETFSPAQFTDRVRRYESATESLARMAGVLGRWGDGSELRLVLDLLRTIWAHAEQEGSGLTSWLGLRSYPAALVFTGYGLGLTRSERWSTLHDLFSALVYRNYESSQPVVANFFLQSWKGGSKDVWQHFEGLENRKTPLSDRLFEIFKAWSSSFVGLTSEFGLLFERFEMLASIALMDQTPTDSLEAGVQSQNPNEWKWIPIGRSAWDSDIRERLFKDMEIPDFRQALLRAGFAQGDENHLAAALTNFKRYSRLIDRGH